jgi:hypothetical protein
MVLAAVKSLHWTVRLDVGSRVLAAVVGGYAVTNLATSLLARLLPLPPADAVTAVTLVSFLIWAAVILVMFAVRSTAKAWLWLAVAALVLGAGLWASIQLGGRL